MGGSKQRGTRCFSVLCIMVMTALIQYHPPASSQPQVYFKSSAPGMKSLPRIGRRSEPQFHPVLPWYHRSSVLTDDQNDVDKYASASENEPSDSPDLRRYPQESSNEKLPYHHYFVTDPHSHPFLQSPIFRKMFF